MHTGHYFGFFIAAVLNYVVDSRYGWSIMFALGGTPAILLALIRYGVRMDVVPYAVFRKLPVAHRAQCVIPVDRDDRAVGWIG
jgi:hypothetical protein